MKKTILVLAVLVSCLSAFSDNIGTIDPEKLYGYMDKPVPSNAIRSNATSYAIKINDNLGIGLMTDNGIVVSAFYLFNLQTRQNAQDIQKQLFDGYSGWFYSGTGYASMKYRYPMFLSAVEQVGFLQYRLSFGFIKQGY
jgi:hypothetical protein